MHNRTSVLPDTAIMVSIFQTFTDLKNLKAVRVNDFFLKIKSQHMDQNCIDFAISDFTEFVQSSTQNGPAIRSQFHNTATCLEPHKL